MLPDINCRACGRAFSPKPYQLRRSDYTCPPCRMARDRAWMDRRAAEGLPWKHPGRLCPKTDQTRERYREWVRRAYRENPAFALKIKVRAATRYAIRSGKLTRGPCEVCGQTSAEAHHDDYGQPLNVRWLCRAHHRAHHQSLKLAA